MSDLNNYAVISVAYRSRLIWRTDAEYRRALGVSYETVVNKRDSERDMEMYYGILSRHTESTMDESLRNVIGQYVEASELYLSLDWGDRSQLASRRKFCRMLFRLYVAAGRRLTNEEIFKFRIKDDDDRLLNVFFPDGADESPAVDIRLITLFAFGILRPWGGDNTRGRDIRDKETTASLEKFRSLVEVLRADTPRLGSTEKPLVFDELLSMIDSYLRDKDSLDECAPISMWSALVDVTRICRSLATAERLRTAGEQLCGLHMYGIWVDDTDGGKNRFWIFPDNSLSSFCYEYDGLNWLLMPYEFKVRFADNPDYHDTFIFLTPEANLNSVLSSDKVVEHGHIAVGPIEMDTDEERRELVGVTFQEGALPFPAWFGWRKMQRLSREDERYKRLRALLSDIYNPARPLSMFFRNTAPELIDRYNNLVGRDNKYLYVYDWQPKRCVVRERGDDTFMYEVAPDEELPADALFELKLSERNPLYAIPLEIERKNRGSLEMERLADVLSDADNITEVYVVYSDRTPLPRLCFPAYNLTVALDMDILAPMGVLKLTRTPFR